MRDDAIETRYLTEPGTGRPHRVQVLPDPEGGFNPREDVGTFASLLTWHRDYSSPDSDDVPALAAAIEQWSGRGSTDAYLIARYAAMFAADEVLFVGGLTRGGYQHNDLILDPRPGRGERFDGVAVVTRAGWREAMGDVDPVTGYRHPSAAGEAITPAVLAAQEVAEYSAWATGEVYGYVVTAADDDSADIEAGEEPDSCWGFIGDPDYAMAEGVMSVLTTHTVGDGTGRQPGYELTRQEFAEATAAWHKQHGHRATGVGWPR